MSSKPKKISEFKETALSMLWKNEGLARTVEALPRDTLDRHPETAHLTRQLAQDVGGY